MGSINDPPNKGKKLVFNFFSLEVKSFRSHGGGARATQSEGLIIPNLKLITWKDDGFWIPKCNLKYIDSYVLEVIF